MISIGSSLQGINHCNPVVMRFFPVTCAVDFLDRGGCPEGDGVMTLVCLCRSFCTHRVCVASGTRNLRRRECISLLQNGIQPLLCMDLPLVQAHIPRCLHTKPQALALWRQLFHHGCNKGGCRQLLVQSRTAREQPHL